MELSLPKSADLSLSSTDAAMYLAIGMFVTDDATLAACRPYPTRLRKSGFRPEFPLVFVICVHTNSSNS